MTRIEAVIFDYGNVIARFDVQLYLRGILPYSSFSLPNLVAALKESTPAIVAYEAGGISSEEFLTTISRNCSLTISRENFLKAYNGIFEPIESTLSLIKHLHGHYRLGLLSNTSEWHFNYEIRRNPIFPLFEAVTVSHEVKARKPAETIYRDMLRKLDLAPEACVYVDDIAEFAQAASAIGMHGIHYTSHDKLLTSLRQINVAIPSD